MNNITGVFCYIVNRSLLGLSVVPKSKPPSSGRVRQVLHQLLGDQTFPTPAPSPPARREIAPGSFKFLAEWLRHPLLIIIIVVLLIGVIVLIRNLAPYIQSEAESQVRKKGDRPLRKGKPAPSLLLNLYHLAIRQSQTGQYRQALISLHKATVEYLLTNVMLISPGKKYTNNDLKQKLRVHQTLYQPFVLIANYAEIAGFSNLPLHEADFLKALQTFETYFL